MIKDIIKEKKQGFTHIDGLVGLHIHQTLYKQINTDTRYHQVKKHREKRSHGNRFVQSVEVLNQQHGGTQ